MGTDNIQRRPPESAPVRAKWDLVQALLPLFHATSDANEGRYEYTVVGGNDDDDGDGDGDGDDNDGRYNSTTSANDDHLKTGIASLRNDLQFNISTQYIDIVINQLAYDDPNLGGLGEYLQALLEELEALVDPKISLLALDEFKVSSRPEGPRSRAS